MFHLNNKYARCHGTPNSNESQQSRDVCPENELNIMAVGVDAFIYLLLPVKSVAVFGLAGEYKEANNCDNNNDKGSGE